MNAIRFSKMHGIGNDYVYIDADAERVKIQRRSRAPSAIGTPRSAATV